MVSGESVWDLIPQSDSTIKVSIELPVTTRHRRDMTDNVESDVKPEQTNKQTRINLLLFYIFLDGQAKFQIIAMDILNCCRIYHVIVIVNT